MDLSPISNDEEKRHLLEDGTAGCSSKNENGSVVNLGVPEVEIIVDDGNEDRKFNIVSFLRSTKVVVLSLMVAIFTILFMATPHQKVPEFLVSIGLNSPFEIHLTDLNDTEYFEITLLGPFAEDSQKLTGNLTLNFTEVKGTNTTSRVFSFPIFVDTCATESGSHSILRQFKKKKGSYIDLIVESTAPYNSGLGFSYKKLGVECQREVIYAACILFGLYILIVFELVHRTVAAMLASLAALATLAVINKPPSLEEAVSWIDFETLGLLFGMMVMVSIFAETGFFDWIAVKAYKIAKGKKWRLVTILLVVAGVISAFLDNVTTILLMTPLTIRLCEVIGLDARLVLIAEVIFSNIGGAATGIGDPPNVIIVSNEALRERHNIDFMKFTLHMTLGIILCAFTGYAYLRFALRHLEDSTEDPEIVALRKEIVMWRRTMARIHPATDSESVVKDLLLKKATETEKILNEVKDKHRENHVNNFEQNLVELEEKYVIKDYWLLWKALFMLTVATILFFIHAVVQTNIGWIATFCAVALLVLADIQDVERVFDNVEWVTLVFFAGLFIIMEALNKMGLITFFGDSIINALALINDDDDRLTVGIIAVLWISGIASAFIDNIPFTTAMVPVIVQIAENKTTPIPIEPLVWAHAFGGCLGGNGTLIAASANVVCAGQAEQHGYRISFSQFFKIGFPTMIVTLCTATVYLLVCHSVLQWHEI